MARGTASPAPAANEATHARAAAPRRLTTGAWRLAAVVAACCVWVGIMCFIFASRADYYVQRYWASIRSVLDVHGT